MDYDTWTWRAEMSATGAINKTHKSMDARPPLAEFRKDVLDRIAQDSERDVLADGGSPVS